ncbi:hypothetical protein [Metabacillus arenae]|uniref:Uncharacterized protein n=1 Tax=Metabacillus arenae TaxID=2771434 RepID=A0A926RW45_9BACI|nr:hypothetical protein [Metabacillus arenae]MBD1379175.1 hypothetical protein [Metabacillus arenae]
MSYCDNCVDGGNELSWLDDKGNIQTQYAVCETCKGTRWIELIKEDSTHAIN